MIALKTQYTDLKNVTHSVEHLLRPMEEEGERERLRTELCHVLGERKRGDTP